MRSFGDNLKALRSEAGYSLEALAKLYNEKFNGKLNKSTISRYENGLQDPIITVVKNFAELFNVSSDYLLGSAPVKSDSAQVESPAFFRLRQGLEPYDITDSDVDFLLEVYKAHIKKNQ